jgi:hypothetical protein
LSGELPKEINIILETKQNTFKELSHEHTKHKGTNVVRSGIHSFIGQLRLDMNATTD